MEVKRVVLVLADISGYTSFTKAHATSLLHAEQIITELLEAVIDAAEYPLTLNKLEGDAVFLYAASNGKDAAAAKDVARQVMAFFKAFKAKGQELMAGRVCTCDACTNVALLQLKAILHHGEVAIKKIRQFEELAGEDVILAHRLLKNTVQSKEYILMSRKFYQLSGGLPGREPEVRTEECEGIGKVEVMVYYPKAEEMDIPPVQSASQWAKIGQLMRVQGHAILRNLGMRSKRAYSHMPE